MARIGMVTAAVIVFLLYFVFHKSAKAPVIPAYNPPKLPSVPILFVTAPGRTLRPPVPPI